ncbi:MAG: triose-phosphate isomerase [Cardiobacteriaceae bacterium]|nr:triose-phosphate isomerase [Cardiobacteriaceae bacterium]
MMRTPIAAANWKMNGNLALIETFAKHAWPQGNVEKIFGLPAIYLNKAHEMGLKILAAEDVSAHESGAHTGEISATMLKEVGVTYAIIGHSERRTDHGENEELLIEKWKQLKSQGLKVIYCIGESLQEYEAGKCDEAVLRQMKPVLDAGLVDAETVIAYEPVWAIGTGKAATAEYAQQVHAKIRALLQGNVADVSDKIRILYGGSVKPDNAAELFVGADIDGFLVGGASLQADVFDKIVGAMV